MIQELTNGTLINKKREKALNKPALRQMNFPLHSFDGHSGSKDKYKTLKALH